MWTFWDEEVLCCSFWTLHDVGCWLNFYAIYRMLFSVKCKNDICNFPSYKYDFFKNINVDSFMSACFLFSVIFVTFCIALFSLHVFFFFATCLFSIRYFFPFLQFIALLIVILFFQSRHFFSFFFFPPPTPDLISLFLQV